MHPLRSPKKRFQRTELCFRNFTLLLKIYSFPSDAPANGSCYEQPVAIDHRVALTTAPSNMLKSSNALRFLRSRFLSCRRLFAGLYITLLSSILPSIHLVVMATTQSQQQQQQQQQPPVFYLARTMRGRLDCPLKSDPPTATLQWLRDGRVLEVNALGRVRMSHEGHLVIRTVLASDEGTYSCVAYSPLRARIDSPAVRVLVRGESNLGFPLQYYAGTVMLYVRFVFKPIFFFRERLLVLHRYFILVYLLGSACSCY